MKNCLVMGFGRSGTSLMSGILHDAGYFMGEDLYPPRHSNPKGFFENALINGINERILELYDYTKLNADNPFFEKSCSPYNPGEGQRWLSYIEEDLEILNASNTILNSIKQVVSLPVFAYKDPRFNYTLSIWEPLLPNETLFLCIFREPEITIKSVLMECESAEYLANFAITKEITEILWVNSYSHLLNKMKTIDHERFIFIHYRQLLSGDILSFLSDILQVQLSDRFNSQMLNRTKYELVVGDKTKEIYQQLCDLASYQPFK